MAEPPKTMASAADVAKGSNVYHRYCSVCHGFFAMSSGSIPDLRYSTAEVFARYKEIVLEGERKAGGMASFADQIGEDDVKLIQAYILAQARGAWDAQEARKAAPPAAPGAPATP
jgi:mono/diheme cytochrome c family protein